MVQTRFSTLKAIAALAVAAILLPASVAHADKIKNPTAVFAGLDKITGRTIAFEVAVDETVQFGSLQLTPRVCYSRPAYERPQTTAFVEVDEITLANEYKRIFSGWMFAASPGLNGIEHPVYDIWLTDCKGGTDIIKTAPDTDQTQPQAEAEQKKPAQAARTPKQQPPGSDAPLVQGQQPTQRYFPTNAPPPPAGGAPRRPPGQILPFDPAERGTNR